MRTPRRSNLLAGLGSLVVAGLILGPSLVRPGTVLVGDLAWPVTGELTPFSAGGGGQAARTVPSDAVAVALSSLVGPDAAERLVLVLILAGVGLGALRLLRRLVPGAHPVVACAVLVLAMWNPFVGERLFMGQWTVLLGYAVLPWAVEAALGGRVSAMALWLLAGGLGGATAWVVVVPPTLVAAYAAARPVRVVAAAGGAALLASAPWALPSIASRTTGDSAGFAAFAAVSDTPLGLVGSLLGGGGLWNPSSHPPERSVALLALLWAVLLSTGVLALVVAGPARSRPVALAAAGLLLLVALNSSSVGAGWWQSIPGTGVVRDSQKLLAAWVVLGVTGLGVVAERLVRQGVAATVPVLALALVGPLSLPSLALGLSGRLHAVAVPADLAGVDRAVRGLPEGVVGLLPWNQNRRYNWNDQRLSLSLVPRILDRPILFDDSLRLRTGVISGEDPGAARVTRSIDAGVNPFTALQEEGVRVVVLERDLAGDSPVDPPPAWRVVVDGPSVRVLAMSGEPAAPPPVAPLLVAGWALGAMGWAGALGHAAWRTYRTVDLRRPTC